MNPILDRIFEVAFFGSLSTQGKIAYVVGGAILMLSMVWMISHIDRDLESDVVLRNACQSAPPLASPAQLFEHFPEGSYSGRCLPEINVCTEFTTADGQKHHYACPDGHCAMYWQLDGESCRIHLDPSTKRPQGAAEFKTRKGRWKSSP